MGTIQDPDPERDRLRQSYVDSSTNPYSIDSRTEMMGRLATGTGGSRAVRIVVRVAALLALVGIGATVVLQVLRVLGLSV